ncbi:MAG: magnesium transporter CorA family protein [Amaricoccus sp.]
MLVGYRAEQDRLVRAPEPLTADPGLIWLDLYNPTREEEAMVETLIGLDVPTRDEMEEIEESSRLYTENGGVFMTAVLPSQADIGNPVMAPVTFVLNQGRLVTVRYHEPRPFRSFPVRAEKTDFGCSSGESVLMALLEAIVDRLADILEKVGRDIEHLSRTIFGSSSRQHDFTSVLRNIGQQGDLVSNVLSSLVSLERMFVFMGPGTSARTEIRDSKGRIKTLARDTRYLTEHANFLSGKITFLLDATLGMIGIEQNAIIKIFSVAAVIFLPPTLIASIYGMNFADMPELSWIYGYPFALLLMVGSAALSFWIFKRFGWL